MPVPQGRVVEKLTINVATRGRPAQLIETVNRLVANLVLPTTRVMISADEDDLPTVKALCEVERDKRVLALVMPREDSLGAKWNRALLSPADVYLPVADYNIYLTKGFDEKILEAASVFPDGIGCVYSHLCNASFPAVQAITHKLVEKLGFMYPPYFPYWFVDHWMDDVARMIDRISFVDAKCDATSRKPGTQEIREPDFWATFFDATRLVRRAQARSIIDSPDFIEPEWRKDVLRKHFPLIEFRSAWANGFVHEMERAATYHAKEPGGERYDRLKAKAVKMIGQLLPELESQALKDAA